MKKRHEKGMIIITLVIVICFFLMYLIEKGPSFTLKSGQREGNGTVLQNSRSVDSIDMLMNEDIAVTDTETASSAEEEDLWILFDELQFDRKGSRIKTMSFSVLLILYVVVIGPILYFLLKKRDKMEWMWGWIPGCAILFAGVILFLGDTISVKKPLVDALTVIRPGQEDQVYLSMTSPGRNAYTLSFESTVRDVVPLYLAGEYRLTENGVMREEQEYTVEQEEGNLTLQMQPREAFSQDYFRLTLDNIHEENVEEKWKFQGDVLIGTLKNDTQWNFGDVMLFYQEKYCVISDFSVGDKLEIQQEQWKTLKEEDMWMGPGKYCVSKRSDYSRILNFAYFKYYASDVYGEQLCFAAVIENHDSGVKKEGTDTVSHGLYYQISEVD